MPVCLGLTGRARLSAARVQSMAQPHFSAGLTAPLRASAATVCVLLAAIALSGCASHIADNMPTLVGGLPEKIPPRSETPPDFPAVHDRPAAREEGLLNDAERKKLKDELTASRDRATRLGLAPEDPAQKKVADPAAKKKVADPAAKKKLAEPAAKKKQSEPAATGSVSATGAAPNP
jgi:hypothetical protein